MESGEASQPKPAATLILTRQQGSELQVYLLKRNVNSRFMAGSYVFPGGVLESEDEDIDRWIDHVDLEFTEIDRQLGNGLPRSAALAYGIAAIRETFEEAGIILARQSSTADINSRPLNRPSGTEPYRNQSFLKQIQSANWTLKLSTLGRWSHWVSPERMPRRYDTRFFWAVIPANQSCQPDLNEVVQGCWISPHKGLVANLRGELPLSPPTLVTLHEMLAYADLDELQKQSKNRRWGELRLPRMVVNKGETLIVEPWDHQYTQDHISFDAGVLPGTVLPVGKPFSRLWWCNGIWKPVKRA